MHHWESKIEHLHRIPEQQQQQQQQKAMPETPDKYTIKGLARSCSRRFQTTNQITPSDDCDSKNNTYNRKDNILYWHWTINNRLNYIQQKLIYLNKNKYIKCIECIKIYKDTRKPNNA
jgi:hypothetical protein